MMLFTQNENLGVLWETQEIDKSGYRMITNIGNDGGQEVPHLHFHLIGGEKVGRLVRDKNDL